jgi:glutaconate CoA-transferase, subunit A
MQNEHIKVLQNGKFELTREIDLDGFRDVNRAKPKGLVDKLTTEHDAIKKYMKDGDYIGVELYGAIRCPMSLVREVIRQGRTNLAATGMGVYELDLMIAAGSLTEIDWTYIGYEVFGISKNAREAIKSGQLKKITEWSNAALAWRLKAGSMGIPFIPVRSMLGTDTFNYSSGKVIECPYTKQPVCLLPAIIPDVGMIHVSRADKYGNCQIDGVTGFASEMARASKRVIISAEEIIDTDEIRKNPERTIIPFYNVDAVVHAPLGSHPGEMPKKYDKDLENLKHYYSISGNKEEVQQYLDKWIYNVKSHEEYLEVVGREKIDSLKIKA